LIALTGNLTGDTTLMAIALMAQLVALAAAVAELRQAQQHAAQAAAARAAAGQLHAAVVEARSHAPRFGSVHQQPSARATRAPRAARLDFPMHIRPTREAANDAEARRPSSPKQGRPPQPRASPHH
jgi:hypothetical protein